MIDIPKPDFGDYTSLGEFSFWKKCFHEAAGSAFFLLFASLGGGSAWYRGISYIIVSNLFNCTLLSTLSFRNLLAGISSFGFVALLGELVSQMFGAFLGNKVFDYLSANGEWALSGVSATGIDLSADGVNHAVFREFAAVAFFLYILNKRSKCSLPEWMFTIAAFYMALTIGSPIFVGSRMFATMCSSATIFTYGVHFASAVFVCSVDYFFE